MNFFYYQIAIPLPIKGTFTYKSKVFLRNGSRTQVSFRNKKVMGIVIKQIKKIPEYKVKEIVETFQENLAFESNEFECLIWASKYYHHPIGDVFSTFMPKLLKDNKKSLETPSSLDKNKHTYEINLENKPSKLTKQQHSAINNLKTADFNINLINGVTGSGKTEIYLDLTEKKIKEGKSILILVPEINLTPQLYKIFSDRFDGSVGLYHSKQTPLQRFNVWKGAKSGEIRIVIGTRSAIMNPLKNLGLIIIDEEHDQSFKQTEGFKFSARELGIKRAQKIDIPIIFGSATPSLSLLKLVSQNKANEVKLTKRVDGQDPPKLVIMDINNQELNSGISNESFNAIETTLSKGKQVLVFINRRGFAPLLECLACGWNAECNSCESSLVYHKVRDRLVCHRCESAYGKPVYCPNCGSDKLELFGLGTEQVEEHLAENFPGVEIIRIDHDSTRKKGAIDNIYKKLEDGAPSILVGTQMLTKGHDFNNVSLTLVLNADNGLISPEINALEKVSQLLIQVSGRAGRKDKDAKVIIQTRYPNDKTLNQLKQGSYSAFSEKMLLEHENLNLPPYSCASILRATSPTQNNNLNFLNKVKNLLVNKKNITSIGPLPSFVAKSKGSYKHSLYIQTNSRVYLNKVLNHLDQEIEKINEAKKVKWSFDIDPVEYS